MQRTETAAYYQRLQNRVAEYVENNLTASFGIRELADYTHVSYYHLAEIFRSTYTESLGHYITRIKLERAAMLSAYTPLNLSEIADATGFATKHSLSKAFTNHFGFSPGKAKASVIRTDSINAVMDGITSETQYRHIVQSDFPFTFKQRTLTGGVLAGYTWHFGHASPGYEASMPYLDDLLSMTIAGRARRCIKIFDSVNFTALRDYRLFYGIFAEDTSMLAPHFDGLALPIRRGTYLVFDVPAGHRDDIKHHITRFRESLVWYKQMFILRDFYDFFLLHDGPDNGGEYYLCTGA
ncbi:AraC family transcriptional regulator [Fulvivirgaceae bacterium PWU5]|uniref:AraC family transcriptional regulator n=1 Tax=Dawidia cretensis TaxID=2782350 RepID=A0AAP2GTE2_9BACT|nr:AraC family transcriptional regulator [Dawidia cretensis]MBT1712154.1 AraC family transcriptional regulator [Dawidia cretensis]